MTTTVFIDRDPSTLGPDATQADLDGYAQNLAAHLAARTQLADHLHEQAKDHRDEQA